MLQTLLPPLALLRAQGAMTHDEFLPHGFCFLWNKPLLWTHVIADSLIGISYVAISFSLAYLVHKLRRDIPFSTVFVAFGLFIVTCGITHFMDVWTLWEPVYWLSAWVRAVTAVASVSTAVALPFVIPRVRGTVSEARLSRERAAAAARTQALEEANRELEAAWERADAARQRADEASRAKSEFLAVMSHELRTPLNAVMGYADLLRFGVGGPVTPQQEAHLGRINASASHLVGVIDQILQFARLEAGRDLLRVASHDPAAVARETAELVEPLAARRQLRLELELPSDPGVLHTDAGRLRQVLLNLLSNAIKFTNEGSVTLTVQPGEDDVTFLVRDTGIGIAPEDLAHLFDPFWQARQGATREVGGTGLGLSVTQQLVQLLGGSITVESEPGRGSTFAVRLMRVPPAE